MQYPSKNALIAISSIFIVFGSWAQTTPIAATAPSPVPVQTVKPLSEQQQEQLRQLLAAGKLDEALKLAQSEGIDLKVFATFAAQNGVSVAAITTTVLNSGMAPSEGLKALGDAFAGNAEYVATVFATAITMPSITMDTATVESWIEAGCTKDCLPAAVVSTLAPEATTVPRPTVPVPSSTANSTTSGSGSGGSKPISPTS